MKQCSSTVKKMSLELGGNAPFIVFDDADLDAAADGAITSKYRNAGQTCVCANRLLVEDGIYDAFSAKLLERVRKFKVGSGLEEGVTIGPLIDEPAIAKVRKHVDDAVQKGAKLALGGRPHGAGKLFFEPTVLTEATRTCFSHEKRRSARWRPLSLPRRSRSRRARQRHANTGWLPISTGATWRASGASQKRSNTASSASTPDHLDGGGALRRHEIIGHRPRRVSVRHRRVSRSADPAFRDHIGTVAHGGEHHGNRGGFGRHPHLGTAGNLECFTRCGSPLAPHRQFASHRRGSVDPMGEALEPALDHGGS